MKWGSMPKAPELNAEERERLFRIIEATLKIRKRHHFYSLVQMELQGLLPHEILICGLSDIDGRGLGMHSFSSVQDFTAEHFDRVTHPEEGVISHIISLWQKSGHPCLFEQRREASFPVDRRLLGKDSILRDSGLKNIAAHGVTHTNGAVLGFFSFSRVSEPLGMRHHYLLEILVPHLYTALIRVLSKETASVKKIPMGKANLTAREKEVLKHLNEGLSNSAIAERLLVSPLTVKNHVQKILYKLQANNRAHAITLAMRCGLLQ